MEKYAIYNDISVRTGGDLYIGVVGPVRTGKSTFISKFMEKFVIPNIGNKFQKQLTTDDMPQSAEGKAIMTTQTKFVPSNAVKVQFRNKASASVRLVDCVGYLVDGATGYAEDDKPRLVKTPWSDEEIPFEKAAEIGTKKVIEEYSTIGILVTTDGSIGDIPRVNYESAEERVVNELKDINKPFVIILNCKEPNSDYSVNLANELQSKYNVSVINVNVSTLSVDDINNIMEKVLFEFPMQSVNIEMPNWMRALSQDSDIISDLITSVKNATKDVSKMRDFSLIQSCVENNENFNCLELKEMSLGDGTTVMKLMCEDGLYYKVLSEQCGEQINNDCELLAYIKSFSEYKKRFSKIKDALEQAETDGYGVVFPSVEEMNLDEPELVKQGGRYGVKLKATAPSLHIIKVDVSTEISPTVGTEKQSEDIINFISEKFEDEPEEIWQTNMFGKTLHDLVKDGLNEKINGIPKNAQNKMRKTLGRMVNENRGGMICILL